MTRAIHWFRNDLRLRDNTALSEAARADELVLLFVEDPRLVGGAKGRTPRARFVWDALEKLEASLPEGQRLVVRRGRPEQVIPKLLRETRADWLSFNRDTSPMALRRDAQVTRSAERLGVRVLECKDRVVFEADQVVKPDGSPYVVYTPFAKSWYRRIAEEPMRPGRAPRLPATVAGLGSERLSKITSPSDKELPAAGSQVARRRLQRFLEASVANYADDRDRPDRDGTSRLSPHLRFGTISIRDCVYMARDAAKSDRRLGPGARKWIDELVWRDFYAAILEVHPRSRRESFRKAYDGLVWRNDEAEFDAWCVGRTGFPIVDAGMRQLASTGWMHNRLRMIVASFLTKDLLIDWRWGEQFFWNHLVDGDPASNTGGWQWAASTGTDAQPYFRILNPTSQGQKVDPNGDYVRKWVPELRALPGKEVHEPWKVPLVVPDYPQPLVDHGERRLLALEAFKEARGRAED